MNIDVIYFDMDGVLADFDGGVRNLVGIEPKPQGSYSPEWDDKLFTGIQAIEDFYFKLEPVDGAIDLFNKVRSVYGSKVEILTGIPKPKRNMPQAADNKRAWVAKYLGGDIVVNTVLKPDKKNFVKNSGSILIDDYYENINNWEKAGGTGILFKNTEDCLNVLTNLSILK